MKKITFLITLCIHALSIAYTQPIDTLWTRTLSAPGNGAITSYDMLKYSPNEFIVVGSFNDSLYMVKFTSEGNKVWEKYMYKEGGLFATAIDKDSFDNFYTIVFSYNNFAQWSLIKYNSDGDSLWSHTITDQVNDLSIPYSIVVNSNNIYVSSGVGGFQPENYSLYKFTLDGELIFNKILPIGANFCIPRSLKCDTQGNIIIAGSGGSEMV